VVNVVKPAVDAAFPTRLDRAATGIMGSSLGGLISLWAALEHADTFGRIGAMSPAILPGQGRIYRRLRSLAVLPERLYLDAGGREGSDARTEVLKRRWSAAFTRDAPAPRQARHGWPREGVDLLLVGDLVRSAVEWARRRRRPQFSFSRRGRLLDAGWSDAVRTQKRQGELSS
jgi:pimeloyl-ACP methyl ester carboxylesterase